MSMRISELARTTGVSLPTVKYYLREGLLPAGRPTAATQADYDQTHVERLRLIRALADVGGLSLTSVRRVLRMLDAGVDQVPYAIGEAHTALGDAQAGPRAEPAPPPLRALALLQRLGWQTYESAPALSQLEAALEAVARVGIPPSDVVLDRYAAAALTVAETDIDSIPVDAERAGATGIPVDGVGFVVLATVLYEPILLALRRLAHAHVFAERYEEPRPELDGG